MPRFPLVLALMGLAGWVDAIGFLQFGHLFVSFMSGNTTQMAVGLGVANWAEAGTLAALLTVFVFGVIAGTLLAAVAGRWRLSVVLGTETLLLTSVLLLPTAMTQLPGAAMPVAAAMGLQNAALRRVANQKNSLTYVTGSLVSLGTGLAEALMKRAPGWAWSEDLLLWLAMASGATAGAAAFTGMGLQALVIPAAVALTLTLAGVLAAFRSGEEGGS